MSLTRLALRISVVEALRPTKRLPNGPFPTACERFVFDTRIEPIDDLAQNERRPIAVVFTDYDHGVAIEQGGATKFRREVDLVIEISVPLIIADADVPEVDLNADPDNEAALDNIERDVRVALQVSPLFKALVQKVVDWESTPHRSSEEGYRLASRTLRIKCQIVDDTIDPAPNAPLVGLDRLPPAVRKLVNQLDPSSYGYQILLGMAPKITTMPVVTPLKTADLKLDVADPSGNRDGAVDVEATLTNLDQ